MGRRNVEQLPKPSYQFRPNLARSSGFESKAAAKAEDHSRVKALTRYLKKLDLCEMRNEVDRAIAGIASASCCASSRYMRKHRIRLGGHLWQQHEVNGGRGVVFTLIPKWGRIDCENLGLVGSRNLLERLRAALNRAGAVQASGWIIAAIHGEHEPSENVYVLHFHGYATGGMVEVIDKLRHQSSFKTKRKRDGTDIQRISRSRAALGRLPRPLTYLIQSFWPAKTVFQSANGGIKRQRSKHRIKEPMHSEVLLWLSRQNLRDLVLLLGIEASRSGLRPSKINTAIGDNHPMR